MKSPKLPFILFFVNGVKPSPQELAQASRIRGRVAYRNARAVGDNDVCEKCDGVAGAVPKVYQKFPNANEAVAAFDKKIADAAKLVGDVPAPQPPQAPTKGEGGKTEPPEQKPPAWGSQQKK